MYFRKSINKLHGIQSVTQLLGSEQIPVLSISFSICMFLNHFSFFSVFTSFFPPLSLALCFLSRSSPQFSFLFQFTKSPFSYFKSPWFHVVGDNKQISMREAREAGVFFLVTSPLWCPMKKASRKSGEASSILSLLLKKQLFLVLGLMQRAL